MGARLVVTGAVLVGVAALGSLSGCSDDKPKEPVAVSDTAGSLPKGDEATYLKAMRALDATLVADEKTAIDNGYNLCLDKANGMTTIEQVTDAANLFQVTAKVGQRIVTIAETNLCKPPASAGS